MFVYRASSLLKDVNFKCAFIGRRNCEEKVVTLECKVKVIVRLCLS